MCQICNIEYYTFDAYCNNQPFNIYDYLLLEKIECCKEVYVFSEFFINLKYFKYENSLYTINLPNTLINLQSLECSNSIINNLPNTLINLEHLDCSHTNINIIPETLINLKYLDGSYTDIDIIPDTLTEIYYLFCNYTYIVNLPETLSNLEILNCSGTDIMMIPETYTQLYVLNCSHTQINYIPETLINLQTLYCRDTNIMDISKKLINLTKIESDLLNTDYILQRQKKIKLGFIKFIKLYKYSIKSPILWKIAEYYTAKKYSPKNILNYINLY